MNPNNHNLDRGISVHKDHLKRRKGALWFFSLIFLCLLTVLPVQADNESFSQVKMSKFIDPNTGDLYRVVSYNSTSMSTDSVHRSFIRVYRIKLSQGSKLPIGEPEIIQTINFHPTLVDFDQHCQPSHCYLVAVTSRSKRNVELYSWVRTQFDLQARRDSFARPHAVRLFRIGSGFYISIAQDQLHLQPYKVNQEDEEPARFIGSAIFKFVKGHEHSLKYHQYIRLPFNPVFVNFFISNHTNNVHSGLQRKTSENYYLVFSITRDWHEPGSAQAASFKWSPLNDYFWPYRLPGGVSVASRPGYRYPILKFPTLPPALNLTKSSVQPSNQIEPIETCFSQLQRLLTDRELYARKLVESSRSLWRSPQLAQNDRPISGLTNITAQVIVRGNVMVRGSLIESPQISLIGHRSPEVFDLAQVTNLANAHSPAIVENRLRQAFYKLRHIRDKLSKAITANPSNISMTRSRVRFFGNVRTNQVIFRGNGIANSNVRLNRIPFRQLEHELVSLNGIQNIAAKVIFMGNVVADKLEIHGLINDAYLLKDALDITSNRVQVIDAVASNSPSPSVALEFNSVSAPALILSHNASFNDLRLDDFITKDNRTQVIYGLKLFKSLSMAKLSLAGPEVLLNGFNISRIASNSLHLGSPNNRTQSVYSGHITFAKPVTVERLIINNLINRHINISSLLIDSVKTYDVGQQHISGLKRFVQGLKISHLTTEGSINGIQIDQIFNLNPTPPLPDYVRFQNYSSYMHPQVPIKGNFKFLGPVDIHGHLNAGMINGVDVAKRAIRRRPMNFNNVSSGVDPGPPQVVSGQKIFMRPLRVTNRIKILESQQISMINSSRPLIPLVNGLDVRRINDNMMRQMKNPPLIYVSNLEIYGNLNLRTFSNQTAAPTSFGNYTSCPLDAIRSKLILAGYENQMIDIPIRIDSLRSRSIHVDPNSFNGMTFPNDFVLKTPSHINGFNITPKGLEVELVYGHKTFEHLSVVPQPQFAQFNSYQQPSVRSNHQGSIQGVILGPVSSINNITHGELQAFISHERQKNSTGETILQTLTVHGDIFAKRVNGYSWPDDILLKSVSSNLGPSPVLGLHRRIYSPLVFINSSDLEVENQLVLRGPIQLLGRLNGVNLTQFAQQSATYGDKDLLSIGRPITNKIFMGGLTVRGEIRSQGFIDGVNIDEMRSRVVTVGPAGKSVSITGPKIFMSDVDFLGPVNMVYLNDLPLDHYLKRMKFQQEGGYIPISGKKTVTGALRINRNLIVQGLINGIDFVDLKARAISLSPTDQDIEFNKTLTIEGDAFMDNLLIDERDGIIDGVKLTNLLPIESIGKNELVITGSTITQQNSTPGYSNLNLVGLVNDCQITCSLSMARTISLPNPNGSITPVSYHQNTLRQLSPLMPPPMAYINYPPRQIQHNGKNITYMRTTPPYVSTTYHQLPPLYLPVSPQPMLPPPPSPPPPPPPSSRPALLQPRPPTEVRLVYPDQRKVIQSLSQRVPIAIRYERLSTPKSTIVTEQSSVVRHQLDTLRQQIVSLNIIRLSESSDLVVGFIEAPSNDLVNLQLPDLDVPQPAYAINPKSFLVLDQIDFPFRPTIYHLSVGVSTNYQGLNVTSVFSSVGGSELHQLSVLPIESPNSAMFLTIYNRQTLFLLISQDYTTSNQNGAVQCPRYSSQSLASDHIDEYDQGGHSKQNVVGGIHVYLFHALQNSSSLSSAYFDLYQTIGLPAIDNFESFDYHGSSYVLAVSRQVGRVYLMILRGYSGFQVVSYIDSPMVENVKVIYTKNLKPMLIIYHSDGLHKLMESVII